jgi:hypothetical protein
VFFIFRCNICVAMPTQKAPGHKQIGGVHPHAADVIAAWFIGPKGENAEFCRTHILELFEGYKSWRTMHGILDGRVADLDLQDLTKPLLDDIGYQLGELAQRFKIHFPFFSPRYIAHMLSEQSIPAILGYFAGMLYNPNHCCPVKSRTESVG